MQSLACSSLSDGKWPVCQDGYPIEPLDALYLLFKNNRNSTTLIKRSCFAPERFQFPPLRDILPATSSPLFTPDDFVDALVCLLLACIVVAVGITALKLLWELDSNFASIRPAHKKWYVVANMSKSFFLGCMCLSTRYWISTYHSYYYDDTIHQVNAKRCGMLYIATDLVALVMVPKLPRSTIMHHVTTTLLIVFVSGVNLEMPGFAGLLGVCKMAILYGVFSTMPFLVNAYLGLRVVYPKAGWMHVLVKASLWPYLLCCACNWTVHLVWLYSLIVGWQLSLANVLYLLAIGTMVNDDIVLIKWLIKRSSPGVASQEKNS